MLRQKKDELLGDDQEEENYNDYMGQRVRFNRRREEGEEQTTTQCLGLWILVLCAFIGDPLLVPHLAWPSSIDFVGGRPQRDQLNQWMKYYDNKSNERKKDQSVGGIVYTDFRTMFLWQRRTRELSNPKSFYRKFIEILFLLLLNLDPILDS